MSQLLILGNTNKFTFCNAIVAAQDKARECLNERLTDIYVIHSKESFQKLFREDEDWLVHLNKYGIREDTFINRIVRMEKEEQNSSEFLTYIKSILKNCQMDKLIIDISNGTSEMKTVLSIIAYILDIPNVYFIDSVSLLKKESTTTFLEETQLKEHYKKIIHSKMIDELAYLNLTEIIRYKEKVNELSLIYAELDDHLTDATFFKENLLSAILLKIKNDNDSVAANAMYRISSTAIASSLEDLIDRFLLDYKIDEIADKTLGTKIHILQDQIKRTAPPEFDSKFLEKFNEFMLYLRNSTTHKALTVSDSEKFKAALSMQMSIVFLDYYSKIVYKELKKTENNNVKIKIKDILPDEKVERFLGIDGDNTGQILESLLQSNQGEKELSEFSKKVKKAKDAVVNYIKSSIDGKVIFAEGDDILCKGHFNMENLVKIKEIYFEKTGGMTCSVAYGNDFKEVLFSMKLAKMEKNAIKGITIIEN